MKSVVLRARLWALSAVLVTALAACGGGGADESVASARSDVAERQAPVDIVVVMEPVRSLTISPGYLDLMVLTESGIYQRRDVLLGVDYVGDGAVLGYAFGETPVSWLSFSDTIQNGGASQRTQFRLDLNPYQYQLTPGLYETTLTVVAGYEGGNITGVLDVPVYLRIEAAPPVYEGGITISGAAGKLEGAVRTIPLDFNGMVPDDVSVTLSSQMGVADEWLTVEGNWPAAQLTVRAKPGVSVGWYAGRLNVAYTIKGAKGTKSIPFQLFVKADAPLAKHVAPGYMYTQEPNVLVVRGHAFDKAKSLAVRVGNIAASSVTVVKGTELRATFDTAPLLGSHRVEVTVDGQVTILGDIDAIARPAYAAEQIVQVPCKTSSGQILSDPRRGNLIGFCDDTYYVLGPRAGGGWDVLATRQLDGVDYSGWYRSKFLLTADQRYIVVAADAKLLLLDPTTLQTVETHPFQVFWHQSAGYGMIGLEAALNNSKIVLTISGGSEGYGFFAYDPDNRSLTETYQNARSAHIVNAEAGAAGLSTLQLVYLKDKYQADRISNDSEVFTVTTFTAPEGRDASYIFPLVSADADKVSFYGGSSENTRFTLYDLRTAVVLGPILSSARYSSNVQRFSESGEELYIVDPEQGRFEIFGASPGDTGLRRSKTFSVFGANSYTILPDQGAVMLHGGSNGTGTVGSASIKIISVPR